VRSYLGAVAARREFDRRPPVASQRSREYVSSPVESIEMRLTYRTMRVMSAIATQPGLSNAEISARAGIKDQGQISKLLSRLAGLELIENTGDGHVKGAPNAWRLTKRGLHVERAIRAERLPRRLGENERR
jgi:chromosome segregation and condensation protein ScpB